MQQRIRVLDERVTAAGSRRGAGNAAIWPPAAEFGSIIAVLLA